MRNTFVGINLFLPLAFVIFIFLFLAIGGFVYWVLLRPKFVGTFENYYFFGVLKHAVLSILGVIAILLAVSGVRFCSEYYN